MSRPHKDNPFDDQRYTRKYSKVDKLIMQGFRPKEIHRMTGIPNTAVSQRAFQLRKRGKQAPKHHSGPKGTRFVTAFKILKSALDGVRPVDIAGEYELSQGIVSQIIRDAQKAGFPVQMEKERI